MNIVAYTDGSASKSRSGYGFVVLVDDEKIYEGAGTGATGTTNQQMELAAVIEALDWINNNCDIGDGSTITIYSDSAYIINCYTDKWYVNWMSNGWKNSKGEDVANILSWRYLIKYFQKPNYDFQKVKGHSGHIYNELADKLATGKNKPTESKYLTTSKKYDKIYIELSEILLNYSCKKNDTKCTIEKIIDIMNREGAYLYKNE
jgi:ribonuclease HI